MPERVAGSRGAGVAVIQEEIRDFPLPRAWPTPAGCGIEAHRRMYRANPHRSCSVVQYPSSSTRHKISAMLTPSARDTLKPINVTARWLLATKVKLSPEPILDHRDHGRAYAEPERPRHVPGVQHRSDERWLYPLVARGTAWS